MDIVYLHNLKCECTIGVWEWEKSISQTLMIDLDLGTDISAAASQDDLSKAINYQAVAERIQSYASESKFELIESLAESLAALILEEFGAQWLRLKVDKGQATKGVKNVGVIIERGSKL